MVPIMASFGLDWYSTFMSSDNCIWVQYNLQALAYETQLRKNIANCGISFKDALEAEGELPPFSDILSSGIKCKYDDILGSNTQPIRMLSGSFDSLISRERRPWSYCFGSISWA